MRLTVSRGVGGQDFHPKSDPEAEGRITTTGDLFHQGDRGGNF